MASNTTNSDGGRLAAAAAPSTTVPATEPTEPADERAASAAAERVTKATPKRPMSKKVKGGKAHKGGAAHMCANGCGEEALLRCSGCGMVHYCLKNIIVKNGREVNACQQVRCHL